MSFLADLFADIAKDALIVRTGRAKNKPFLIVLGLLTVIIGSAFLLHLYSRPPTSVDDFYIKQFSYDVATSNSRSGRIVLKSDSHEYVLLDQIWQNTYSREFVVEALNKSGEATVWIYAVDSHEVAGVETKYFSIDPTAGADWRNRNNRIGMWICWTFVIIGLGLITLVMFTYWRTS